MDSPSSAAPDVIAAPVAIGRNTWLLIAMRAIRSVGQGALVVDFSLYLQALGWSAVAISIVLSGALIFGSVLTLIVGPLSDRIGRRKFLLAYEGTQLVSALAACVTGNVLVLGAAGIVGGFGRGGNGAAGPFSPVEQAWLAQSIDSGQRGRIYSLNAAGGSLGMGAGALLAASPAWFGAALPGALSFRPLFALAALCSFVCIGLIWRAHDSEAVPRAARPASSAGAAPQAPPPADDAAIRKTENGLILRLIFANLLNGSGIGLTGPLISYWFAIRFNEGPEQIGPLMALGFVLSAVALIGAGRLSQHIGVVRAVVWLRLVGVVMLVALPFAPSFGIAAVLYTLRSISNRGTMGARNALNMALVRQERRGTAASAGNVSMQVPRAIGPVIAGALFQNGFLQLPFLIGAAFQAGYIYFYYRSFAHGDYD